MNIGILSPFNPSEFKDYLSDYNIPAICKSASSVNALVLGLLEKGNNVHVFTCAPIGNRDYIGNQLKVTIINNQYPIIGSSRNNRLFLHNRIINAVKKYIDHLDVIHAQWTYEYALAASKFSKIKPTFCTVRDWCPYIMKCQKKLTDKFFWYITSNYIFKQVLGDSNIHFIANSTYTYQSIKNRYPKREIDIVPNSIKEEFIKTDAHKPNDKLVCISIAQTISESRKNIKKLLIAFNEYIKINPKSKLKLVGRDCVDKNVTVESFRSLGILKNVELCGYVNHDDLMKLLDTCDVLIHPSLEETFGNILIEGMARGVLVIGGEKAGAVPSVLENGKAGILCDVTNVHSIVEALSLAQRPEIRKQINDYASQIVQEKYSNNNVAYKQIKIYQKYLSK